RELLSPLRVPMDEDNLALLVERRFPQLGDRLISALQFARAGQRPGENASGEMIAHVRTEAIRLAEPLNFREVVATPRLLKAVGGAAIALAALGTFGALQADTLGRWFQRNVMLANVDWPQDTYLSVAGPGADENGDFTVLRGEDMEVVVTAEGRVIPPTVTLHATYPSVGRVEEELSLAEGATDRYVRTLEAVAEPFEFYVTGGDDQRDKRRGHRVRVVDPPSLRQIRFTVEYPGYQQQGSKTFDGTSGLVVAPVGSWVSVEATASKDLRGAVLHAESKGGEPRKTSLRVLPSQGPDGQTTRRGIAGRFRVEGPVKGQRTLRFVLTDAAGYTSRRGLKYVLQIEPDAPPSVDCKPRGVGAGVTPNARLPLDVTAKEDHGLSLVQFAVRVGDDREDRPRRVGEPIAEDFSAGAGRDQAWTDSGEVDLEEAFSLEPGQTVHVRAEAEDNLPASFGGPNVGTSSLVSFRIVKPEKLTEDLIQRQKEIANEFRQAIDMQNRALAKSLAAREQLAAGQITPDVRRRLKDSESVQASVGSEVVKAGDRLRGVLEEMRNNRLGTPGEYRALTGELIEPLADLARPIEDVRASLGAARDVQQADELQRQAGEIAAAQQRIQERMAAIAERMQRIASRRELAARTMRLYKMTVDWVDSVKKIQESETTEIWEDLEPGGAEQQPETPQPFE
ncbi:MAG: hypothetical protein ACOC93_06685, partial [Planctomycetota bacterium]